MITSNHNVEGWHHSFNSLVRATNPIIGSFINELKEEQTKTELLISQIESGLIIANKQRKAYRNRHERLRTIVLNYDANHKLQYLKNIAKASYI